MAAEMNPELKHALNEAWQRLQREVGITVDFPFDFADALCPKVLVLTADGAPLEGTVTDAGTTLVKMDTTDDDVTVNLPPAADMKGRAITIMRIAAGNVATIVPDGAEEINGEVTHALVEDAESVTLMSDGSNWFIVGSFAGNAP